MEIPSPQAGVVKEINVKIGDKVSEGSLILTLEAEAPSAETETKAAESAKSAEAAKPAESAEPAEPIRKPAPAATENRSMQEPAAAVTPESAPAQATPSVSSGDIHADVVVLGAGPGGYTAAFRAADLGKKVVLIERYPRSAVYASMSAAYPPRHCCISRKSSPKPRKRRARASFCQARHRTR